MQATNYVFIFLGFIKQAFISLYILLFSSAEKKIFRIFSFAANLNASNMNNEYTLL